MTSETPPSSRRSSEIVRAVEQALGRFLLDVGLDAQDKRRLAIDLIEALTSVGIILVGRHHRPVTSENTSVAPDESDTFHGKTD